jgi:hypothetical protein
VTTKSYSPSQHALPGLREYFDYIPEDRLFKFNYDRLRGKARRQLDSYLRRFKFQRQMKQVYLFEINKLILNEALASASILLSFKILTKKGKKL